MVLTIKIDQAMMINIRAMIERGDILKMIVPEEVRRDIDKQVNEQLRKPDNEE